jgi:spermidine/putrescine transport system substrate-binding protein
MIKAPFPIVSRRRVLVAAGALGAVAAMPRRGWAEEEKRLNVYNWDTYIGSTTLQTYTDKTGVQVQYDLFANNEELLAKLKEGNPGYDVIFQSDYMVQTMTTLGILTPLDHGKLSNIGNIDPNFANPTYDPGMKHSVPYKWGTVGIGYRKSKVEGTPDSWGLLLDSDKYSGREALLADQRIVLGCALKYLGYSMNSTKQEEINKARDLLIKQKPHIKAFAPDEGQNMLMAGDVDIVMEWNGDIRQVMDEDSDLSYVIPKEGTNVFIDNICIPKDAPHPENAHAFINHILDPQVEAEICNTIHYATPNAEARKLLPATELNNPTIYPPPDVVAKSEPILDVGEFTTMYDKAWTEVQAA